MQKVYLKKFMCHNINEKFVIKRKLIYFFLIKNPVYGIGGKDKEMFIRGKLSVKKSSVIWQLIIHNSQFEKIYYPVRTG